MSSEAGETGPEPKSGLEGENYTQRIHDRLERYDQIEFERIKIQEGIRQTVASWGIGALAAIGVMISAAAWISYDGVVADISEQIREDLRDPINDQIDTAVAEKIENVSRRAELVASTAETALQRELERVVAAERAVNETLIEARTSISTLKATTEIVNESASEARSAAENARRTATTAETQVAEIQARLESIQSELDERVARVAEAVAQTERFQERVREIVKDLGDERKELRQETSETAAGLQILEAKLEAVIASLNGEVDSDRLRALEAEQERLAQLQSLHVNFYVARIGGQGDIDQVLALHNGLVEMGVPNKARLATEDSIDAVAAEIDDDFVGVRRFLTPGATQLFAPKSATRRARALLSALKEIAPDLDVRMIEAEFSVQKPELLLRPGGETADPRDVVLIVKSPADV